MDYLAFERIILYCYWILVIIIGLILSVRMMILLDRFLVKNDMLIKHDRYPIIVNYTNSSRAFDSF